MTLLKVITFIFLLEIISVLGNRGHSAQLLQELHVKFTKDPAKGFFKMPLSVKEIENEEFVWSGRDEELNACLYCYPNDPRVCLLFDSYGNIAGIQTGYIKDDIERMANKNNVTFLYDYRKISGFKEQTFLGKQIYSYTVTFLNPKILKKGGRKQRQGRVENGVYAKLGGSGKWVQIAPEECKAKSQGFTKQSCIPKMGQHYFFKATKSLKCEEFEPFFSLYEDGLLIGYGVVPFGSFTFKKRDWFELATRPIAEAFIPFGPECTYEWTENYGGTSLHVFFKPNASTISCPTNFSRDTCISRTKKRYARI